MVQQIDGVARKVVVELERGVFFLPKLHVGLLKPQKTATLLLIRGHVPAQKDRSLLQEWCLNMVASEVIKVRVETLIFLVADLTRFLLGGILTKAVTRVKHLVPELIDSVDTALEVSLRRAVLEGRAQSTQG